MGLVKGARQLSTPKAGVANTGSMGFMGGGKCVRCPPVEALACIAFDVEFDALRRASVGIYLKPAICRVGQGIGCVALVDVFKSGPDVAIGFVIGFEANLKTRRNVVFQAHSVVCGQR